MNEPGKTSTMMSLGDPSRGDVDEAVLDAPGGFAWWYVDTIDEHGDGAVIIWSWGLPFLPGYLSGVRAGRGDAARDRPSLNVALYRGGRRHFYLLQTYAPGEAELLGDGRFRFGRTRIETSSSGTVQIDLDCDLFRTSEKLTGRFVVEGPRARLAPGLSPSDDRNHRWTPVLGPARARAVLEVGSETVRIDGPAYHDRNEGTQPFDQLGIDHWSWGRLVTATETSIWYVNHALDGPPMAWGVRLDESGIVHLAAELEPRFERPRSGPFGLRTWDRIRLLDASGSEWIAADTGPRVDDGPFYARTLSSVRSSGREGPGLGEWIVPHRIDLSVHRPLVRMAVHNASGPNSIWLPLFSGPKAGRLARLLGLKRRRNLGETAA